MFTKGNITYSEAFKYLKLKDFNMVVLRTTDFPNKYEDVEFNLPVKIEIDGKVIKFGGYFSVKPKDFSYGAIKTAVIKMRYSNDDQMALMLNKDKSEEDAMLYNKMQEWREFASYIAAEATKLIN